MSQRLQVAPHLSVEEIKKRFRKCRDGRIKSRWQAIWLCIRGRSTKDVAEIIGCQPDWVRRLVRRWNFGGPVSLDDGRKSNCRKSLLTIEQKGLLHEALMGPCPDGGLWNGKKVAEWISKLLGRHIPGKRGWVYLRQLGFTSQTPRPRHQNADKMLQEKFKKNSPNYIPILRIFVPRLKFRSGLKMKHV